MDAVLEDLPLALFHENPSPQGPPTVSRWQFRERDPRVEEAKRLAGEMRIWGEVIREVPLHVRRMCRNPRQNLDEELRGEHRRRAEKKKRPAPGNEPQGYFEATRPVDSPRGRVGRHPFPNVL